MRRLYVICFVSLMTIFISCYLIGYYVVIQNNKEEVPVRDYYEVRQTIKTEYPVIKKDTIITIENYNKVTGVSEYSEEIPTIGLLGLDKASYIRILNNYMRSPSTEDVANGFICIDLVEFSSEKIVVRKTFEPPVCSKTGNFILYAVDGMVIIYYEDFTTIYDYTDIKVTDLPVNLQKEIYFGKQIRDLKELYEFLEAYSS